MAKDAKQVDGQKQSKPRSPNHPVLDLASAIERVTSLHGTYATHAVPLVTFCKAFNYAMNSSGAIQLLAALRAYGLVDVTGRSDDRKVTVSKTAERIIRNAPDRKDLIRNAALAPPIHQDVWEHYEPQGGLPHDDVLKQYLLWDRPEGARFTDDSVGPFIERLRNTLDFAGITCEDKSENENGNGAHRPGVGDFVQWESQGADQFTEPRRVTGISEDGAWAFVEGSKTGLPMTELSVVDAPTELPKNATTKPKTPPANPHYEPSQHAGPRISFPLSNDNVFELTLRDRISKKDFERLKKLIDLSEDSLVNEDGDEDE